MVGEELKILFNHDQAYLASDRPMSLKQLGLPDIAKNFKPFAYWIIMVLDYFEFEKKIYCEIISYEIGETSFEAHQILLADKLRDLQIVVFKNIDTYGLLRTLASSTIGVNRVIKDNSEKRIEVFEVPLRKPRIKTIKQTFSVPLKNVHFKNGGVSFDKKFHDYKKAIALSIPNNVIKEEFDAVKNYFANVLKTKRIEVTASIEITDNEITFIEVKSPEIDRIDSQFIENVRLQFVKSVTRNKTDAENNKVAFTIDEYFETFGIEKIKPNAFYSNCKDLIEDILKISNTKHYKHLRFLSSKHLPDIMKLRFVQKPFSFIFLLAGERNYHIIWETLNTKEATWIWQTAKDINALKEKFIEVEDIIRAVRDRGKKSYLNSVEDHFSRVHHDYSNMDQGFVKWKDELESVLS
ncbi:MAG: hypothetical protein HOP30_02730 [Cyclobacteriaceae bacterium]|nr:hypothetical protein [Cyclobacteriaceae bacterium]